MRARPLLVAAAGASLLLVAAGCGDDVVMGIAAVADLGVPAAHDMGAQVHDLGLPPTD